MSCQHRKVEDTYFNGEIKTVEFTNRQDIKGTLIELNDAYKGDIMAYDTILIVGSGESGYAFNIFSIRSGDKIGKICQIGQGPDDFVQVSISNRQLFKRGNNLYLWVGNYTNGYNLVNITASLKDSSTVIDQKITQMMWAKKWSAPFGYSFILDNNYILARTQAEEKYIKIEEGYDPIAYHLYKGDIEKCERNYVIYKKALIPKTTDDYMWVKNSLLSYDGLHPNHQKIAMGMNCVGQLNIFNIASGKVKGYRLKDAKGFDFLTKNPEESCTIYYNGVYTDEKYIYASYCGETVHEIIDKWDGLEYPNIIHVYDWEGKAVIALYTDKRFSTTSFDPVHKKLYTQDRDNNIYCYDMNFLY